jgi:hypothetical protein
VRVFMFFCCNGAYYSTLSGECRVLSVSQPGNALIAWIFSTLSGKCPIIKAD